jgi:large subunit ribosomal protein L9
MEVILRTWVEHLGERGDVVKVADGYARNYLLPRKLALPATVGNRKHVERERQRVETHEAEETAQAEALAARLKAAELAFTRRVGDTEQLYGSVTAADIAEALRQKGFDIDRRKLVLPDPLKTLGAHEVPLKVHRAVTVALTVTVSRQGGEPPRAEAPAEGAAVTAPGGTESGQADAAE